MQGARRGWGGEVVVSTRWAILWSLVWSLVNPLRVFLIHRVSLSFMRVLRECIRLIGCMRPRVTRARQRPRAEQQEKRHE